jgi:cell division protein FtsB
VANRQAKQSDLERVKRALPVLVALVGSTTLVIGLAILPARTWLSQRSSQTEAEARVERLEAEVAQLDARLEMLSTDAEIERLARKNFDLVYPGEESYRILPSN